VPEGVLDDPLPPPPPLLVPQPAAITANAVSAAAPHRNCRVDGFFWTAVVITRILFIRPPLRQYRLQPSCHR
jgi:hypothetical protein